MEQELAIIYARFSTDKQTDSIDTQIRRNQRAADVKNLKVIAIFVDRAVSGTSIAREGLQKVMSAVQFGLPEGKPTVAIVSDISRLSRDLGAMYEIVFGDLPSYGARTLDAQTGMFSDASGARTVYAAMGMAADSFAEQTRIKTRDGLQDRARDGYWTGGAAYGYRTEPEPNPKKPESPYWFLRIDEVNAPFIREIFQRFANGETTRVIADDLNRRKVEAPRTNSKKYAGWGASTIRYILRNERYAGVMRYGTHRWFKHPRTGKRRYLPLPESEHIVRHDEALRIVDQETWTRVQARFRSYQGGRPEGALKKGYPKYPLTGKVKCGICTGPMVLCGSKTRNGQVSRQLRCSVNRNRGDVICSNGRIITVQRLMTCVADKLKREFAPEEVKSIAATALHQLAERRSKKGTLEKEIAAHNAAVTHLANLLADPDLAGDPLLTAKYKEKKAGLAKLKEEAKQQGEALPSEARVLETVAKWATAARAGAQEYFQNYVDRIVATPGETPMEWSIEVIHREVLLSCGSGGGICAIPIPVYTLSLQALSSAVPC